MNLNLYLTHTSPISFCFSAGMLKAVSLPVDLIMAHFNSRRDPEEKIRLGNSLLCTTMSYLVLKKLCPAIQNILQDGLKAYQLDLIIGQRRNKLWNVVEATARPGLCEPIR
uniref:RUN domain-containing protein n=1 Tax=Sinocyclocheilus anshuiensis TaxID=1608454 RepID=A0A671RD97_9TELE